MARGCQTRPGGGHQVRRRPRACPRGPPVQRVGQGGAPPGPDVLRPGHRPHRGSAQAPSRAVDPTRMTKHLPGPGDLRGRLLRLTREEQGDPSDRRREPRADVAPRQRPSRGLAELEDQLAGTRRSSGVGQPRDGPDSAMAGLTMGHDRRRDEPDLVADRPDPPAEVGRAGPVPHRRVHPMQAVPDISTDEHACRVPRVDGPVHVVLPLVALGRVQRIDDRDSRGPPAAHADQPAGIRPGHALGHEHGRARVPVGPPEQGRQAARLRCRVVVDDPVPGDRTGGMVHIHGPGRAVPGRTRCNPCVNPRCEGARQTGLLHLDREPRARHQQGIAAIH